LCSPAGEFRSKPSRLRYLYIAMDFYIECTIVYCLLDSAFLLIVAYHILVTDFYKMFIDTKPGEHAPGRAPRLLSLPYISYGFLQNVYRYETRGTYAWVRPSTPLTAKHWCDAVTGDGEEWVRWASRAVRRRAEVAPWMEEHVRWARHGGACGEAADEHQLPRMALTEAFTPHCRQTLGWCLWPRWAPSPTSPTPHAAKP
jgi:hypothetical protein